MNSVVAAQIVAGVVRLTELSAVFQAKYGQDYLLKPGSPDEAWKLYRASFEQQAEIARMLDLECLESPFTRYGAWWGRREMVDTGILNELALEAFRLVSYCASYYSLSEGEACPLTMRLSQEAIAGMLHPAARQLGTDRIQPIRESA